MRSPAELQALLKQKSWDKELVLWLGSEKSLTDTLTSTPHETLDLLDLFDVDNLPSDEEETREFLRDALKNRLKTMPKGPEHRTILVVKAIGLLAKYRVGLNAFFDWFIGSRTLAVLHLDRLADTVDWPEEVRCDSARLLDYFQEPGMVKDVYSPGG